jgi:hypothetical protein
MIAGVRCTILMAALAPAVFSQSLNVYSEFARIDDQGKVIAPDEPREILSPAAVRNGFTAFQIVVKADKGTSYWLHVGQNPDQFRIAVYKVRKGTDGNLFDPVTLPVHGDDTEIFWMDLWCPRDAPVRRVKVEPELAVDSDWIRYPMEVRVMEATVPDAAPPSGSDPRALLCGPVRRYYNYSNPPDVLSRSKLIERDLRQDAAMAARLSKEALAAAAGTCSSLDSSNPESYLRIRDFLLRMR